MTIPNQNVKIYRGNSATLQVTLTTEIGTPYTPAVGDELKYRISRNAHSLEVDAFVSKSLDDGITVVNSVASIDLTVDDTDLEPGLYYHELKIVDPPDDVATAMIGTVIIKHALDMTAVVPPP